MTTLATQRVSLAGVTPSFTNAAASQKFKPGPRTFLRVKNTDGSTHTISVNDPNSVSPTGAVAFNPDVTVTIPATTGDLLIGPFDSRFADAADSGLAAITWSATTGMSAAVLSL